MGLFSGFKWKNRQPMPGDLSEMTMAAPRYDDAGNMQAGGLIQGGETRMETMPGFWQGGDKITGRDVIGGILAAISDGLAQHSGGPGGAVQGLSDSRFSAIAMAKKAQEQQAQQAAVMEAARARGINPADVTLVKGGFGSIIPKQDALPERARLAQWYQNATPQERAAFDQTNPIITGGYGSTVVPRSSLPDGLEPLSPDEIKRLGLPEGGPASRAPGGFPPRLRR